MGDAENVLPSSKKRAAGREISRDNPGLDDEEDSTEHETGTFKRASDEVLATRKIVKVRRNQSSAASNNPFAAIRLVPSGEPAANAVAAAVTEDAPKGYTVSDENKPVHMETEKAAAATVTEDAPKDDAVSDDGKTVPTETEKTVEDIVDQPGSEIPESAADKEKQESECEAAEPKATDDGIPEGSIKKDETAEDAKDKDKSAAGDETVECEDKNAAGDETVECEDKKVEGKESVELLGESAPLSSFQQLSSSQNAFSGLSGSGFSTSTFSFGSLSKDGSAFGTSVGAVFGEKADQPLGLGLSTNGSSSLFNTSATGGKSDVCGFGSLPEVPLETGEENEKVVLSADSALFEYLDGAWKERGKGELKVNVSTNGTEKARLLMRARGNFRLILNASLYPDMKLTNMEKRGITFACVNSVSEAKDGLSTFALKFKDGSVVEEFRSAVTAQIGKVETVSKTPENSPKATDE